MAEASDNTLVIGRGEEDDVKTLSIIESAYRATIEEQDDRRPRPSARG